MVALILVNISSSYDILPEGTKLLRELTLSYYMHYQLDP